MRQINSVWVSVYYACCLIYSDSSGLSYAEQQYLDDWERNLPLGKNDYYVVDTENYDWKKCDITNLKSNCYLVKIYRND